MLKELDDYDWEEAFEYAEFDREDVAEIIYLIEGENDGDEWCGVFKLNNGKYGTLHAGCDYTGWDCQAGGDSYVADDLRTAILGGLDEYDRKRLGIDTDAL